MNFKSMYGDKANDPKRKNLLDSILHDQNQDQKLELPGNILLSWF